MKCSGCKQGIAPDQYVRKQDLKIFHTSCLKCHQCQKEAATGEQFHIVGDGIYLCKNDYENTKQNKKTVKRGTSNIIPRFFKQPLIKFEFNLRDV